MSTLSTAPNEKAAAGMNRDGLNFISSTTTPTPKKELAYAFYYIPMPAVQPAF